MRSYLRLAIAWCVLTFVMSSLIAEDLRLFRFKPDSDIKIRQWQSDLRSKLFQTLMLRDRLENRATIDFQAKIISSKTYPEYELKHLEIQSTPGRRIKIAVTIPSKSSSGAKLPAVVCIHGHGGNRESVHDQNGPYRAFAQHLAKAGYVTIATDVGQHHVYEKGQLLMGERLWDVMRCVDYVSKLPEVDTKKIGCAGLSLGGEMAMWLGAMDTRIQATLVSGFLTSMDQLERNHCMCWKFPGLRELVDFADIYALTAPRPLHFQNGRQEPAQDFAVPLAERVLQEIKPAYRDLGKSDAVTFRAHPEGHVVDVPDLMKFFEMNLPR